MKRLKAKKAPRPRRKQAPPLERHPPVWLAAAMLRERLHVRRLDLSLWVADNRTQQLIRRHSLAKLKQISPELLQPEEFQWIWLMRKGSSRELRWAMSGISAECQRLREEMPYESLVPKAVAERIPKRYFGSPPIDNIVKATR